MNITLSADEKLVHKAREVARHKGLSLNQLIRIEMRRLTEMGGEAAADEFLSLTGKSAGKSPAGFRFDRDEAHVR